MEDSCLDDEVVKAGDVWAAKKAEESDVDGGATPGDARRMSCRPVDVRRLLGVFCASSHLPPSSDCYKHIQFNSIS